MADEIKTGSVVRLKSGGPKMTVDEVAEKYGTITAWCTWFVQDKAPWKKESDTFPVTSLEVAQ
ncbi:MAG TPA: DUF2158 domain-containing protein [Methylosinus sp.]|uniref:DUF2158 domain-containing protein n=1 Tax=Methylosinus sp. TaxID=427 RepID=UPI002F92B657